MKRRLALLLISALTLNIFSGCSSTQTVKNENTGSNTTDTASAVTADEIRDDENLPADANTDTETAGSTDADKDVETDDKTDDTQKEETASEQESSDDVTPGMTEDMLARSIHFLGDTSRLASKLKKARDDNTSDLNIVFLGDSITAGSTTSKPEYAFVNRVKTWCRNNISKNTNVTNSGIGATNSYLGVHRLERDVFAYSPDIIFVEFINDTGDQFYKATMESLIRRCLAYENDPAVILIEMSLDGGGNAQDLHDPSAEYYGVPVLSYHDAITPEISEGNISFRSSDSNPANTDGLSPDGTHPNDLGHLMVFQMIRDFLESTLNETAAPETVTPFDASSDSITGDIYKNAKISDRTTDDYSIVSSEGFEDASTAWYFPNGWSASQDGATITFKMEFQNLGMLYYKTTDKKTGIAHIVIDGEDITDVNGDFPNGWGDYAASTELYRSDKSTEHTVTVTIKGDDTRQRFEILGWLIS